MSLPPLDDEMRQRASENAIAVRRTRAEWKLRLERGDVALSELLEAADQEPALAGMRITEVLGSLPGVGPRTTEHILSQCGIAASRRIRGLGSKQRAALLAKPWGRTVSP